MKILVTGAAGFVGKNLVEALKNIRDGKDRTHPEIAIETIFEYDIASQREELVEATREADFVFHLAGVNRPRDPEEFMKGNFGFSSELLSLLEEHKNTCPVMLSSSIQASLIGRYAEGDYGKSKRAGEELFFAYAARVGARVLVYRFPNLFGKWCRPQYNSAVATFCYNRAHDLPIQINDPMTELELCYIDDLVAEMIAALSGREHRCEYEGLNPVFCENGSYCAVPCTHHVTLGEIAQLLEEFKAQPLNLKMPEQVPNSFAKKLYATYLSYLPREKAMIPLKRNEDARGFFAEIMKTQGSGQFSVNVSLPGITKGQHWHHSKWELFIVVSGQGLIRMRKIGSDEVFEYSVSGDEPCAVHMLPGYTHSLVNLSDTEKLVTLMWANEEFDPNHPDTYFEEV